MPVIVKCDVCGQICNRARLNSHKRLAHGKITVAGRTDSEIIETIRQLYNELSDDGRRLVKDVLREPSTEAADVPLVESTALQKTTRRSGRHHGDNSAEHLG